jgi:hypothetical protein
MEGSHQRHISPSPYLLYAIPVHMTEAEKNYSLTVTMSENLRCYSQCKSSYHRDRPRVCGYISSDLLVKAHIAKNEAANRPWDSSLRCSLEVGCLTGGESRSNGRPK